MKNTNLCFEAVVRLLSLENNSPRLVSAQRCGGLWELKIRTTGLEYDVFYDEESGELPGISFEPRTDVEYGSVYPCVSFDTAA